MLSDPIADMLTRIRNGYLAHQRQVEVPYSRVKEAIAKILVEEGFAAGVEASGKKPKDKRLLIRLKYEAKKPVLTGIKRISKPGVRTYSPADKLPLVQSGFGISIVSTPKGIMTAAEARKKNVGGEVICNVW